MKRTILFTILLPVLIGCGIDRNQSPDTQSDHASSSTHYFIVVKDKNQTPLPASAMPDNFRLSDPITRIFTANPNGCIEVPKNYAFTSLRILCRGYLPQDIHIDQVNDQNQIEVTLMEDPDKPDECDGL